MIKISINRNKSQFPLAIAKGSTKERLQKTIEYNDRFFENIKDSFENGDVKPRIFERVLRKTAGKNFDIRVFENTQSRGGMTAMSIDENANLTGYAILLPVNAYSKGISKMTTKTFMRETFHLFNKLLNPKYAQRAISFNNKCRNSKEVQDFYNTYLYSKEKLTKTALKKLLKGKSAQEQIDTLQHFRYQLMQEQDAITHTTKYQRQPENPYPSELNYKETTHRFGEYGFPEKIRLLEEELLEVIKKERAKK